MLLLIEEGVFIVRKRIEEDHGYRAKARVEVPMNTEFFISTQRWKTAPKTGESRQKGRR